VVDGQSELGNDYATMRLLQLSSQAGAELLQCLPSTRSRLYNPRSTDSQLQPAVVEHIYESPDTVRRAENVPCPGRNDLVWNQQAAVSRYELPAAVNNHELHLHPTSPQPTSSTIANYSL